MNQYATLFEINNRDYVLNMKSMTQGRSQAYVI